VRAVAEAAEQGGGDCADSNVAVSDHWVAERLACRSPAIVGISGAPSELITETTRPMAIRAGTYPRASRPRLRDW
jgi:hypothetical protein